MKVIIVGGVAGGASAAARLRRLDEDAQIIMIERTGYVSYANCGLPYYIGGSITEKEKLTLQTPESFWNRFHIDVRVKNEVLSIDKENKKVKVRRLEDGSEYEETYDKLILSPGAKAVKPDLPGIDGKNIFTLRTVEDTYKIKEYVEEKKPRRAVVVGGGFIGLEMAENLLEQGISTTLLQRSAQVMPPLDYDMASFLHAYLKDQGLDLRFFAPVVGYEAMKNGVKVLMKDGSTIETDMVLLAIGVVPDSHLAKETGLELGTKDAIVVNEKMQTSYPDIYAVGDAVEVHHFVTRQKALISLAGPANKQGRIAANNICGIEDTFAGSQGSAVLKAFDMTVAVTGINEKIAKAAGIAYDKVVTFSPSHATYYPGANNMTVKTLFHRETGKILGAQIVGFEGVDKRIDVMATAIRANMTGAELEDLDLAYAPPFSSAKDPVNMAGFVIENVRNGIIKQYHWEQVEKVMQDKNAVILDVSTPGEFAGGHIEGAINIPVDALREHLKELDSSKKIYVNCFSGLRSYIACRILTAHGLECYNLSGGYRFYGQIMENKKLDITPKQPCGMNIDK